MNADENLKMPQELHESSVAAQSPPKLSDAQLRELARRAADDDANPDDATPWEQVKAEVLAQFKK